MADFAFLDERLQNRERFFDRYTFTIMRGIEKQLSKDRDVAARPVQLIEIDVIRLQTFQTALDGGANIGCIKIALPVAYPGHGF